MIIKDYLKKVRISGATIRSPAPKIACQKNIFEQTFAGPASISQPDPKPTAEKESAAVFCNKQLFENPVGETNRKRVAFATALSSRSNNWNFDYFVLAVSKFGEGKMTLSLQKIARLELRLALKVANRVESFREKCIALAWVARFSPDSHNVLQITNAAIEAAGHEEEQYKAVSSLAWPLRALLERDEPEAASNLLKITLKKSKKISPPASKSEALFLVFQAVMHEQDCLWPAAFEELSNASLPVEHWRQRRNMREAILMIADRDLYNANSAAEQLGDDRLKRTLLPMLATGKTRKPRIYFLVGADAKNRFFAARFRCRLLAQGGRPFIHRIAAGLGLKPDIAVHGERADEMTS